MAIKVIFFGQLADITGNSNLVMENVADTHVLQEHLHARFPAMEKTKYRIAIDKKIMEGNTSIHNEATVALLPPFSGG